MRTSTVSFLLLILTFGLQAQEVSMSSIMLDTLLNIKRNPGNRILIDRFESVKNQSIKDGDTVVLVKCLQYQSVFFSKESDYANFSRVVLECNSIVKDTSIVPLSNYITSLNNTASLEKLKGNHKKANELYFKVLDLEKKNENRPKKLTKYYYNLALNYMTIGDYKNALSTINQSIKYASGKKIQKSQIIRGGIFHNLEEHSKAIESLLLGLTVMEENESLTSNSNLKIIISGYQQLAKVYLDVKEKDLAKKSLNKVLKYQKLLPYRIYKTREIESQLLASEDLYEPAILKLKESLAQAEKQYKSSKEYPVIVRLYKELGDLYVLTQEIDTALLAYQKGLTYFDNEISFKIEENPKIENIKATTEALDILQAKANTTRIKYYATDSDTDFIVAQNAYKTSISLIDKMKEDFITEESKFYVVERSNVILKENMELLSKQYDKTKDPELLIEIFLIMEKNKGSILFQSIKQKFDLLQSGLPKTILEKESDLKSNISFQSKLLSEEKQRELPDAIKIKELTNSLFEANEEYTIHKQLVIKEHKEYYDFTEEFKREKSLYEIQEFIDDKTAIIEYFASDKYLYTLTILKTNVHFEITPYLEISTAVQKLMGLLSVEPTSKSGVFELEEMSKDLAKKLLNAESLQNISSLVIIPDGRLTQIPFESLKLNNSDLYILEKFNVAYHYSVKQFIEAKKVNHKNNVLCLAPQFAETASASRACNNEELGGLKYAKEEAEFISGNFESKLFISDSTNINDLLDNIKDYSIIHLATHACLNIEDPMMSEIHFNDKTLTNYDIQNLNVRPELVVLSACNTGQGKIEEGEGVISLSRGFLEAGVKSIQSSLWPLDDYSSSEIVKNMYSNLKKGQKKSEALRNSKLAYLSTADKRRSHPYYWAGIVHIGNDSALFSSFNYTYLFSFIAFCICILCLFLLFRKK